MGIHKLKFPESRHTQYAETSRLVKTKRRKLEKHFTAS